MEDIIQGTSSGLVQNLRASLSPSPDVEVSPENARPREKHKKHKHKRSRDEETDSTKKAKKSKKGATQVADFDPSLTAEQLSGAVSVDQASKEERRRRKEAKRIRRSSGGEAAVDKNTRAAILGSNEGLEDAARPNHIKETKEERRKRKEEKKRRKSGGYATAGNEAAHENGEIEGPVNGQSPIQLTTESRPSAKRATKSGSSKHVRAQDEAAVRDDTPPSSPETASQLKFEPSATPLVALTPNTAKRLLVTRPLRAPASSASPSKQRSSKQSVPAASSSAPTSKPRTTKSSRPSSSSQRQSEDKVDDATLKKRLNGPQAIEEWIANNWVTEGEMRRLERAGVLIYKKGKFTEDEKMAIRQALQNYQKVQRMNDHQLVDLVMSTKLNSPLDKGDWRAFWLDLAAVVPGRPVAYVQRSVQRMYDPKGHKGAWTPEEDDALMKAYVKYPNQWGKISEVVDRTLYDCRDRYTKELSRGSERTTGRWAPEEEEQLIKSVNRINRSLGRDEWQEDDIPWELVAKDMGGKRSLKQCRIRWSEVVLPKRQGLGSDWSMSDRFKILDRIERLKLRSEKHLDWKTVQSCESLKHLSTKQISNAYHHLKRGIPSANSMAFDELLQAMRRHTAELQNIAPKRIQGIKSKARVVSDDEGEGEDRSQKNKGKLKGTGELDELESSGSDSEDDETKQGRGVVIANTDGMSSD
ncbi:hypothetical protein IAU59_003730 [Kwoniella sp. CBS 9459]